MAKNKSYLVGTDIGGTKIMAVVMDRRFRPRGRARKKSLGRKDTRPLFERICDCISRAVEDAGIDGSELGGIGVGSPGPLDPKTGVIIDSPNINWRNFPLAAKLRKRFGVPVAVDNDVNLGVYGEYHFGAARGGRNVVGLFPGTGIGGGIIIDGALYHGASGAAGEIGHVVLDPNGPLCGCGRHGCLEAFSGRLGIAGQLAAMVLRGRAPYLADDVGSDLRDIRSGQIAEAIRAGETVVEQVVRQEAGRMGLVVAAVTNILSPDTVVLGGGLVEAMPKLFVEEVAGAIKRHALPFLAKFVKVVAAKLGDDATVMGAAKLIGERLAEGKNGRGKSGRGRGK